MVYVVTYGAYSSYGISGVYSTEELAKEAAGEHGMVEYYALDEADDAYGPWLVRMSKDGHVNEVYRDPTPSHGGWFDRDMKGATGSAVFAVFIVWARTQEQAIKGANEQRTQVLAAGRWGENGALAANRL